MGWLAKRLAPDNTEELRPGFFVQKKVTDKGETFKQVYPVAWNDRINWKNLIFGPKILDSTTFWFLLLMLLCFFYWHDVHEYKAYYEYTRANLTEICIEWQQWHTYKAPVANGTLFIDYIKKLPS